MYRVIIADDERHIVQLIRQLLDCEHLNVEVVGEAADGISAFNMILEKQPDILITDIRMPCMDGIELIEQIRRDNLPVNIIAISGHRRFDYAYNALRYGVSDFIVKPINRKELNDSVAKLISRLNDECERSSQIEHLQRRVADSDADRRDRIVEDCLGNAFNCKTLEEINRTYAIDLVPGQYVGISVRIDLPQAGGVDLMLNRKCRLALDEYLRPRVAGYALSFSEYDSAFHGFVNLSENQAPQFRRQIKGLFEILTVETDIYARVAITVGVGTMTSSPERIADSVCEAAMCARVKCVLGAQRIYFCSELDCENMHAKLPGPSLEELRKLIDERRMDAVQPCVEGIFFKPRTYYLEHPFESLALVDAILGSFIALCKIYDIDIQQSEGDIAYGNVNHSNGFDEMLACVVNTMCKVLELDQRNRVKRNIYPVEYTKNYITEHLSESFLVEDIAEKLMLNASYLSSLFKKETGETISEYTQRFRLERAKALLRTTNLNINEIATRVGYSDARHFSKLFKKVVGARPQDYRRMYAW